MSPEEREKALKRYADFLEALSPERLGLLEEVCAPAILFQDPFNKVEGVGRYRRVLEKMYEDVPQIAFTVKASAPGAPVSFLGWRFEGRTKSGNPLVFEGVSEIEFDEQGRVTRHRDHWDAAGAVYEGVPLLGGLLRAIKKRLSVD